MILGDGDFVRPCDLSPDVSCAAATSPPANLREAVRLFERQHILDVLALAKFDKRDAARLLGISLASLYRKLAAEATDGTASEED